jgi:hypothetical protein
VTAFAVTSREEDLLVRSQIGFYASTPSYRAVMRQHGWEPAAERLSELVRQSSWGDLPAQVSDEMLSEFAVVCEPQEVGARLKERYAGLADRIGIYLPFVPGDRDGFWKSLTAELK